MAARHLPALAPRAQELLRRLGLVLGVGGVPLRFGRVYLRAAGPGDWTDWAKLRAASRDFLVPWESTWPEDVLTWAAFRRRLRRYNEDQERGNGYYFLVRRSTDDMLVGGINLTNIRRGISQSGMLGYWIGAEFARQGFMTEAMRATLSFAFGTLGLNRVEAACLPENIASRALLIKCGFRQEGCARKYLRINGRWQDHLTFAMLREDWAPQAKAQSSGGGAARGQNGS